MFAIGHLIAAVAHLLDLVLDLAFLVILVRVILSWANADPYNALVQGVFALTEPFLAPLRRLVPPWKTGGLDLSPLFAGLVIELLRWFLVPTLFDLASRMT